MEPVTAVIVFQDSMPWLDLCLEALKQFKNDTPIQYVFIENRPHNDAGAAAVDAFISSPGIVANKLVTTPPPCCDGRAHEHGLNLAYETIKTEWTLFLDADCIPVSDHWLDKMLAYNADMVGPVPDSGIGDYSLPILHPCLLLFRTKLAAPPYWNKFFGKWNKFQTIDHSDWDVCRPFTYSMGIRPDVKQIKLCNGFFRHDNHPYFRIYDAADAEYVFAIHIREGSKALLRHPHGDGRDKAFDSLPYFSWYTKKIVEPFSYK